MFWTFDYESLKNTYIMPFHNKNSDIKKIYKKSTR